MGGRVGKAAPRRGASAPTGLRLGPAAPSPGAARSRPVARFPAPLAGRRILLAALTLLAALALTLLPTAKASAHPLGNFTTNTHDGLVPTPTLLRVTHLEDLAEIPATQAEPDIRRTGMASWASTRCRSAAESTHLTVDGHPTPLTPGTAHATLRPGQAGLHTLRVECHATAPLPREGATLTFRSPARPGPGWHEITAQGDRTTLTRSDVPRTSTSRLLTHYPKGLLSSPPDVTTAALRVTPGGPALTGQRPPPTASGALPRGADRWTSALTGLVARHDLTPGFAALALAGALVLGALHALAPGHGKTLMAAAAAARGRARLRDVLPLAASVTVTHTLGVVALGALVIGGSTATPSIVAWLGVASGVLVTGAGLTLVRKAWRNRLTPRTRAHTHDHDHSHSHEHDHSLDHSHPHPTAPTLRGALFLGFAGGLVPSPSAVVVLVGAAALGQAWFGTLLVVAYGAGLAVTLTAAGFVVVRAGAFAGRRIGRARAGTWRVAGRLVPLGSACVVLALGCGLVFKGAASALG
ncbi:sulfite exporter TauE/SafE family protein [Streptomyces sp. VRA16 Mangrove soil]|uniref:HoxN/HupN/NixA family nickel/cobalt transporter n=1 Tax=Streptomyces sp. VRA16 Mangrove soil TaxID=2817434 RepID=UPI001A9E9E28|nr:sulfite exporter TauE/SafE family protein [Streptomyces sp. VRA16 Mangrove soil]MBO1331945.1 sulfite exporter TauE/SafE family protein [Streptomyces sp. VRA16 Mangrove soil]